MKSIIAGAVMALTTTMAGAAEPDYASANVLLPACKVILEKSTPTGFTGVTVQQIYDGAICAGMMSALLSVGWDRMLGDRFCVNVPPGATREQAIRVTVQYIEARPQRMHEPFVSLAVEALHDAWPCE
jgi:Rap1a immunity proteins